MSDDKFTAPTFSKSATYSGRKRISVEARKPGYTFDVEVLRLEKEKNGPGWALVLPSVSNRNEYKPAFYISSYKPLKEAKMLATALVIAAESIERLESLRGATELPEWARHLKKEGAK